MRSPLNLCIKNLKLAFSSLEFFSGEYPMLAILVKPSKPSSPSSSSSKNEASVHPSKDKQPKKTHHSFDMPLLKLDVKFQLPTYDGELDA